MYRERERERERERDRGCFFCDCIFFPSALFGVLAFGRFSVGVRSNYRPLKSRSLSLLFIVRDMIRVFL